MKIFELKRILLFALLLLAAIPVSAQLCGRYHLNISPKDAGGKALKEADVKFLPSSALKKYGEIFVKNSDGSTLSTEFPEGFSFRSFQILQISADGFKTANIKVKLISCENRNVIVKLAAANSKSFAVWQFENKVQVRAVDENGKDVGDARLTVTDEKGKFDTFDIRYGFVTFSVPNGNYVFKVEKTGYATENLKADLTSLADGFFKVNLKLLPNH